MSISAPTKRHTKLKTFVDILSILSVFYESVFVPVWGSYSETHNAGGSTKLDIVLLLFILNLPLAFFAVYWLVTRYLIGLTKRYPFMKEQRFQIGAVALLLFIYFLGNHS